MKYMILQFSQHKKGYSRENLDKVGEIQSFLISTRMTAVFLGYVLFETR